MQELQPPPVFSSVRVRRGTSVVRLYGLEPVFQLLREWSITDWAFFKSSATVVYGELQAVFVGGTFGCAQDFRRGIDQAIQCSPKLVKELSQLKSEVVFREILESTDKDACPIALMFGSVLESLWLKKGVPFRSEGISVHHCALDAPLTVDKPMHLAMISAKR
jgi:hypothetical protein